MGKPIVAIVGRPNVGKSTLFNKLAGSRISIVEDTPGVTRDRIYADCEWLNYNFTLIDTGGLEPESNDIILRQMFTQAQIAIETADVIMFVVDFKTGLLEDDMQVAQMLRKTKKPIVLVVNKIDDMNKPNLEIYDFYSLGLGDPIAISAGQGLCIGDMLDEVVKHFNTLGDLKEEEDDIIRIAIIGRPNVGKSSLINKILGEDRLLVSDIPGTTRDAIDTPFKKDGQKYVLIDTAGMRRKSKIHENIERYSIIRAVSAVERADVCVLLIDATEGVSDQDAKIAGIAHERGKAAIIAVNKWDLIEKDTKTMNEFLKSIANDLSYMAYAERIFISAKSGQRVPKLFDLVNQVHSSNVQRISTGLLNDVLIEAMAMHQPPTDKGKMLRIYYVTQVSVRPPTFVLFVNEREMMHYSYRRYIENQFREAFGFKGTPIHFIVRNKSDKD